MKKGTVYRETEEMGEPLRIDNSGKKSHYLAGLRTGTLSPGPSTPALGGGPWDRSCGPGRRHTAGARTEVQQGGGRGIPPFLPLPPFVPTPPTGHVQRDFNLPEVKGQTYTGEEITQPNDARHICIDNMLCVSPHTRNFACMISFQSYKKGSMWNSYP